MLGVTKPNFTSVVVAHVLIEIISCLLGLEVRPVPINTTINGNGRVKLECFLTVFALIRHESNQMLHRDVLVPNPNVLSGRRVTIDNVLVV